MKTYNIDDIVSLCEKTKNFTPSKDSIYNRIRYYLPRDIRPGSGTPYKLTKEQALLIVRHLTGKQGAPEREPNFRKA
jgi:hypothetical protein